MDAKFKYKEECQGLKDLGILCLTQYRLNTAKEMLKSSEKQISEIYYLAGFNELPHFLRVFKKYTGLSPSRYRKNSSQCNS